VSSHRPDIQTTSENDELHSLKSRNDRDNPEHEKSRRLIRNSGEFRENTIDPTTPTKIRTRPGDSDLVTAMPISTHDLQLQEPERKLQNENNSLKKVKKKNN
jgi:hypothetical protein